MITRDKHRFIIEFPDDGPSEVLHWLQDSREADTLSVDILQLVERHLRQMGPAIAPPRPAAPDAPIDLLSSLYNWQEAQNELHRDETAKERKKMLRV